jgi:hypothetical protein
MTEEWKPVPEFKGLYEVSNHGRIRTIKTGKIKKPTIDKKDGRPAVLLWEKNKYKLRRVGRIVLRAFCGEPISGHECCHNDGDPTNNHLSNLRWDTASANQKDRVKHGTSNRGEQCGTAKLTEAQARAIIADRRLHRIIAEEYGVQQSMVSRIKSGKRWGHLQVP